jgi:beta-N-acetylhexosaminidase
MRFVKWLGWRLAWLAGVAFTLVGIYKNSPVLVSLRGPGTVVMVATSIVVIALLVKRGCWQHGGLAGRWLLAL